MPEPGPSEDPWRLQEDLRQVVESAREEYLGASAELNEFLEAPISIDGGFRFEDIKRRQRHAFDRYRQTLKEFADLVLGKLPEKRNP